MFLTRIPLRAGRASASRFVSQSLSSLILISILAVSMPAAPRALVDAAEGLPGMMGSLRLISLEGYGSTVPTGDPQIPAFDTAPLALAFNSTLEFAADVRSMVMPANPAGLENAKIPTFGERAHACLANVFSRVSHPSRHPCHPCHQR